MILLAKPTMKGSNSNNSTVRKRGEIHQMNRSINLVELLNDTMLKAPLATVESYNPSPRSLERKDSSPYGTGHPVWIRRQTDISIENKQTITTTMHPFVTVGRCLGLVATKKALISYIPLYFFCLTISFAIVRTLMSFTNIERFDETFVSVLIMLIHYSKCLLALYYLRRVLGPASSNFYGLWEDVVEGAHRCPQSKRHIKKWVTTGVWFAILGTAASSAVITLGSMRLGFDLPGIESILVYPNLISLNGLFMFIASTFDFMLQAMYLVLCMAIYFEFDNLLRKLSLIVMLTNYDLEYHLKIFRLHHYQLIDLTDQLDSLISYYAFVIVAGNLPVVCCLLYVLGNVKITFGTKLLLGFWIAKLISEILLVSLAPSTISYIAVQPLLTVHEISNKLRVDIAKLEGEDGFVEPDEFALPEVANNDNDEWLTKQVFQQTFLFVNQLTKRPIGISCGGFFIITKETLLTIVSVMITYFALILQLDLSAQFHCDCDCNDTMTK